MSSLSVRPFLVLLILLLAACGSRPSNEDVRRALDEQLRKSGLAEVARIGNLERVNGYALNDRVYVVEVKYDLVFTRSFRDLEAQAKQAAEDAPLAAFMDTMSLIALQMQYGNFKAGDRVSREAALKFIRTEKGWRIKPETDS